MTVILTKGFKSQSATDAKRANFGTPEYWEYLERHAIEIRDYFLARGDVASARRVMSESLSEALAGNDGD